MKIIGITGGVGAGKTQILEYLSDKYGASVCQTDKVAKKLEKRRNLLRSDRRTFWYRNTGRKRGA